MSLVKVKKPRSEQGALGAQPEEVKMSAHTFWNENCRHCTVT